MAESITLTAPFVADPRQTAAFHIRSVLFSWEDGYIAIKLGGNGLQKMVEYVDTPGNPIATNLMSTLNKLNLSTRSLQKRILERLVADGHITGTVSGTPD